LLAKLAKEHFKTTKRRAKAVLLQQLLATHAQEAKPAQPPAMGKPPHDSECTRPASKNNSEG
jgi:hypothetical protein